jgi:hypothetical protein
MWTDPVAKFLEEAPKACAILFLAAWLVLIVLFVGIVKLIEWLV